MLGSRRREAPGSCSSMKRLGLWVYQKNGSGELRLSIIAFFPRPLVWFCGSTCRRPCAMMRPRILHLPLVLSVWCRPVLVLKDPLSPWLFPRSRVFHLIWRLVGPSIASVWSIFSSRLSAIPIQRLIKEGIWMLDIQQRSNYNLEGPDPTQLQLLRWEFPKEHWGELLEGSKTNFFTKPPESLLPNDDMHEEQQTVAGNFVGELMELLYPSD